METTGLTPPADQVASELAHGDQRIVEEVGYLRSA